MRFGLIVLLLCVWGASLAQTQRSVRFTNGNQLLAGTLSMPSGTSLHPAVLIVLGSGATNRDGEVDSLKPFQAMATQLVKKGFAVLRYDNRSKGRSPGKPIDESTTTELASDAQAAFRFLESQKQIDSRRIGFIGHSEGATIAAIAASKLPQIRWLIVLNGPALAGYQDILLSTEQRLREAGTSDDGIRSYLANMQLYLGQPAATPLEKRRLAAQNIVRFEMNRLPVDQRAKITKADIKSAVDNQMHEVLSRWEQHYLHLNPAVYYQHLSCPIRLLFSENEVKGLLSKRLAEFRKVLSRANQAPVIRLIKHVDHNLVTTGPLPKAVSSAFLNAVVEEASKSI